MDAGIHTPRGGLIAFEGIDGSGKSTQVKLLTEELARRGFPCCATREPTDAPVGSLIRQIMTGRLRADNRVTAALFAADRLDHLLNETDGVARKVRDGVTVVTDRYYFSSYAYHAVDMDMDWVIEANRPSAEILRPALTVFLDVPVETAFARIEASRARMELYEERARLNRVRENYFAAFEKLAGVERVAVIDGSAGTGAVARQVWEAVAPVL